MEKFLESFITFWLAFFVWQRGLFYKFFRDLGLIIKTFLTKVIQVMKKKVLYIVAKKNKKATSLPEAVQQNLEQPLAPPAEQTITTQQENPTSTPVIVTQSDMIEEDSNTAADIVIRLESDSTSSPSSDIITMLASYHLAVMNKLNTLVETTENLKSTLNERISSMALNFDALTAEVARVKTVQESAVKLLKDLAAELTANVNDPAALTGIIDGLKGSTDALAAAIDESDDVLPTHTVILNADNATVPTVEVILPEVMPEVVEVVVDKIVDTVDPASTEPQYTLTVEEASPATVEAVETAPAEAVADSSIIVEAPAGDIATTVIETPAEVHDITVAAPVEAVTEAATDGVAVLESVQEAFEATPEVTATPVEAPAEPVVE